MNKLYKKDIMGIFEEIKKLMIERKDDLISLDSVIGDGDLGLTMSEGFTKICENFEKIQNEKTIGNFLMKAGFVMANAVPSTMGTLIATAIMKSGSNLKEKELIETSDIIGMFRNSIEAVEKRGKSKRGEKTLLDAFYPAMEEADKALSSEMKLVYISEMAYNGAKKGVEETKNMQSVHGKAACFGVKTIGHQDPGATVVMYIMEGIYNYIKSMK